jgi:signal transduction histidine kinase/CheY-like chemotaxis protein
MLSSEAFTEIVHSFEGGVVILNDREEVCFINHWFVKASYINEAEILNRKITAIYPELKNTRLVMAVKDVLTNKLPAILSNSFHPSPLPLFESETKTDRIQQLVHLTPLKDGVENYCVIYIQDVSSANKREKILRQQQNKLEISIKEVEKADQVKSDFLANMSHEIRTPLNGMIGSASLLNLTKMDGEQQELVATIRSCGENLLAIINDILDFSKIESGQLLIERAAFNIRDCVEDCFDLFSGAEGRKNLDIYYDLSNVPEVVSGDITRLRQVLVNLISNAIKFTKSGDIFLDVKCNKNSSGELDLLFSVKDSGIGISEEKIKTLFNPFIQADVSTTKEYGGTGLGLAICKSLVNAMGGDIQAISHSGKGSEFSFNILVQEVAFEQSSIDYFNKNKNKNKNKKLLLIEKNKKYQTLICEQINNWGIETIPVDDIKAATKAMKKSEPYLILASLDLSNEADKDFVHWHNITESIKNIPLVILHSGMISIGLCNNKNLHYDDFIIKPIKKQKLASLISKYFYNEEKSTNNIKSKDSSNLSVEFPAKILMVEDNIVNQKIMERMLVKLGYKIQIASNGSEALVKLLEKPYDLVFMDLQMPVMDGLKATKKIRKIISADQQPYIMAMTANALEGDKQRCLEAGMDDYLSKPLTVTTLRLALKRVLEKIHS